MKKTMMTLMVLGYVFVGVFAHAAPVKTKLALNWKAEPEFGGFYTAQISKAYEKNGLDVEVIQGGSGTPTVQMLAAGQMDFGIVSGDEIAIARANGADVVALFAVFQKAPYAFMLRADSPIKDIKGLFNSDATLALEKGLPYAAYLEKKFGFKKVKVVPHTGGIASFLSEKNFVQQCFVSSEPLTAAKKGVKTKTFLIADAGFNPYTVVLAVNGKTLKEKPDMVKSMVKAVKEGWETYLKTPGPTHELIAKLNPSMTVDVMTDMHKVEATLIESEETKKNGLGSMSEKRWQELANQMKDLGLIKRAVTASELFVK